MSIQEKTLGPEIARWVYEWDRSSVVGSLDDKVGTSDPTIHHFRGSILIMTRELFTIALCRKFII